MAARPFSLDLPVRLLKPDDEIIQLATELGRQTGRDADWTPTDIHDAVAEIILQSNEPVELGVVLS